MGMGAIGPADCALLFGVPLTVEDFADDLAAGPRKDYVAGSFGYAHEPVVSTLWAVYRDIAQLMNGVADEVGARGVTIVRRASAADIAHAAGSHAVITIVAHWRDGGVRCWEIEEPRALATLLQNPRDEPSRRLRGMLQQATMAMADAPETVEWCSHVARDISAALPDMPLDDNLWVAATADSEPPHADVRRDVNGAFLRRRLPHMFCGTIGVELRDDIHPAERIAEQLPARWSGTLDLTVCHSILLGELVKRRTPATTVITNRHRASPQVRLNIYRELIRILEDRPGPYAGAMLKLRDRLSQLRG
jgi:hypothetical protein